MDNELTSEEISSINAMLVNATDNASIKGASEWVAVERTMADGSLLEIRVSVVKRADAKPPADSA